MWVYNIPSTVKVTVEPDTIAALAADGTVVGVKDSSGGGETFAQLVMLCRTRGLSLHRFVGSVWRATMAGIGAHGIIPGIANLAPRSVSGAWEAGQSGDRGDRGKCHHETLAATRVTQLGSGSSGTGYSALKSALKVMGIIEHDTVSAPFRGLDQSERDRIPPLLEELGLR